MAIASRLAPTFDLLNDTDSVGERACSRWLSLSD